MSRPDVVAYYADRTEHVLRKYGPGPLVHFHTGLVDALDASGGVAALHRRIVSAQTELLRNAGHAWNGEQALAGQVLDVGAGLGGGALYWAQEFGAHVTALTDVPRHVDVIRDFAASAGCADRVEPLLHDAASLVGPPRFDAAVAIESSCYLPRRGWFASLDRVLRPGARVHLIDCFTEHPEVARSFDAYWRTRIGSLSEYERAAGACGFALAKTDRLNARVVDFWSLSIRRSELELADASGGEVSRLRRSLEAHRELRQVLAGGELDYLRLTFERS